MRAEAGAEAGTEAGAEAGAAAEAGADGGDIAGTAGTEPETAGTEPETAGTEPGTAEAADAAEGVTATSDPAAEPRLARLIVATAAVAVALAVLFHAGMVFFHVAPKNAVSTRHKSTIDAYMFPELAQNWAVFAPNPLLTNSRVLARAELRGADGRTSVTQWVDMTAYDLRTVRGTLVPSMTMEQFRQGWKNFKRSHDRSGRPVGKLGRLTEQNLKRLALERLRPVLGGRSAQRVQFRELTQAIQPPEWTGRTVSDVWKSRAYGWLTVTRDDLEGTVTGR
ncbi:DUF5819 family protein [Streptomyces tritici]|uniref:DUF5819 family protein n=1 Tax=Streptomyces tritici TaxID=2054410 RepID=UPI003AF07213